MSKLYIGGDIFGFYEYAISKARERIVRIYRKEKEEGGKRFAELANDLNKTRKEAI